MSVAVEALLLKPFQEKMQEYLENSVRLGWPVDPEQQQVWIYRSEQDVDTLWFPTCLSGETVLSGFLLDLS